jgi:acetyltransferase
MSTYRLDRLVAPRSLAVVGASPRRTSVGRHVIANIVAAGFAGPVHVVNPNYPEIEGIDTVGSIDAIAGTPDVVVIAVPPAAVPETVAVAGEKGAAAAIIITAGLGHGPGSLAEAAEHAARATGLRLVGPNCLGILVPPARFNASFATRMPAQDDLAVISQSGAIVAGMIEWAAQRAIGFSAVISVGDQVDVHFGDLLDLFAADGATRAIVLYVESIKNARKFMSAARAAARAKPVIVIKAGRHTQGAKAAATHTGALAGSDAVYDAAFRRAGLLRVFDLKELFDATETLGRLKPFPGGRLAILTNGGGIGVLAVDRLIDLGGVLAELSPATRAQLDVGLPSTWSKANPVDIVGDADAARYAAALEALLADTGNDAVLVLNVPTALASAAARRTRSRPSCVNTGPGLCRQSRCSRSGSAPTAPLIPRSRRRTGLSDGSGCRPRLYPSGALGAGPRCADGNPSEPARGLRARCRSGATAGRSGDPRRPPLARPTGSGRGHDGLRDRDGADAARPRCRPSRRGGEAVSGCRDAGGGQDIIAGYRP